ncbi:MAG: SpoVG family protein, partial [Clostridia bacterium]|nr:SpoVG family protein [Clostridia bacterium]
FVVHDVKVIYANDRHFIVMPSRKNADGTYRDIAHPITAAFRAEVEEAVLRAFEEAKENMPAEEEA